MSTNTQTIGEPETVENEINIQQLREEALDRAAAYFRKSPSSRSKKPLPERVRFIFDEIQGNWEHSCNQEREGLGKRRYWWHGSKTRFLDHYLNAPCTGLDYLRDDWQSEFYPEEEQDETQESKGS